MSSSGFGLVGSRRGSVGAKGMKERKGKRRREIWG